MVSLKIAWVLVYGLAFKPAAFWIEVDAQDVSQSTWCRLAGVILYVADALDDQSWYTS